ncbi:hypothetical protein [Lolliginicoccus suaedae]|uniref:hypothetical protein n=1 Tax=Lolliginicoccus suaedae TaxID=2605429 RepID=UPI0011EBE2EA|nr:hypothetical protein [Lolliginicoccus suaedae]
MLQSSYQAVVPTEDHLLELSPGDMREIVPGAYPYTRLATFAEDTVLMYVGISYGPVDVTVELHDSKPPQELDRWEDVAEGIVEYKGKGLVLQGRELEVFLPTEPGMTLTPAGSHRYGVRVHANGKGTYYDGPLFEEDPVEQYLIQLWPTTAVRWPKQLKNDSGR